MLVWVTGRGSWRNIVYQNTCLPTCKCTHEHAYLHFKSRARTKQGISSDDWARIFEFLISMFEFMCISYIQCTPSSCLGLSDQHVYAHTRTHIQVQSVVPGAAQDVGHIIMAHVCMDVYVCIYIQTRICTRTYRFSPWFQEQHKMFGAASRRRCVTLCVPRSISSCISWYIERNVCMNTCVCLCVE